MKNGKKLATLFLAAALAIGFAMPACVSAKGPDGQKQWLESLSDSQRASAKKIIESNAPQMHALRQELEVKRDELGALRKAKNPDTQAMEKLYAEIGAIRGKMLACRASMKAELRAAGLPVEQMREGMPKEKAPGKRPPRLNDGLSAEQKAKAQAILDQHMADTGQARDALAAKNAALAEAMAAEKPDTAKIEQISREIGEIRGQIAVKRLELRNKFAEAGLPENTLAKKPGKPGKDGKFGRRGGGHRPDMGQDDRAEPAAQGQNN